MKRSPVQTPHAPAAIGPYSQAVKVGPLVFASGQIPLEPQTGALVTGDIEVETRRALDNLCAVLKAAGARPEDVVKTTIFLVDLADFARVNAVYASYFGHEPPARSTVQVAALPAGARIEIEAIAHIGAP